MKFYKFEFLKVEQLSQLVCVFKRLIIIVIAKMQLMTKIVTTVSGKYFWSYCEQPVHDKHL